MTRTGDRLVNGVTKPGGYRDVLRVGLPLALSTSSWGLMHFVDRMFLSRYSNDALAAAVPGSVTNFLLISLFIGTATYVNTFIAQYIGAKRPQRVGSVMWQGIYFSIVSGLFLLGALPLGRHFFALVGHDAAVQEMEVQYFRILCCGSGVYILGSTLSCFFIGRGKTLVVLGVNFTAALTNILLDRAWIFGKWGFPALGIRGAGYATVTAIALRAVLYMAIILLPSHRRTYATLSGWRPNRGLFRRLMRFGLPSGVQFMLEVMGFSLFILFVGKISKEALAATNVTFNINSFAFMSMLGFAFAVSTLVGQYLGANRPNIAERSANSAFKMTCAFTGTFCLLYLIVPELFLQFFGSRENPEEFAAIRRTAAVLLRFVAVYSIFDMLNIIYANALKGAGDTRFVMWVSVGLSWPIIVIPTYLICVVYKGSIYTAWGFLTAYVIALGSTYYLRFRGGKWKTMRVIEVAPRTEESPPESTGMEVNFAEGRGERRASEPVRRSSALPEEESVAT